MKIVLEPRPTPPISWLLMLSAASIFVALLVLGVVFLVAGLNPFSAYATLASRTLGDWDGWSRVIQRAIPLVLIGVGLVLAFRAQFFNIGAEGQLLVGAVAGSAVALFLPSLGFLTIPIMFLAGFIAGAIWGFIPAILKLKLEVNEVITTLMLNYVAATLIEYLITGPWKGQNQVGFSYTDDFPAAARLPLLGSSYIHIPTLLLGLILAVFVAVVLSRTRLGFRMRILGESIATARYVGINAVSTTLWVVMFSAGAAGLAGVGEVAGIHGKLLEPGQISLGYGYTAIIVAWLARGSPIAAIFTALFLGISFAAGDVMKVSLQLPANTTNIFNGTVLMLLIATEPLVKFRVKLEQVKLVKDAR